MRISLTTRQAAYLALGLVFLVYCLFQARFLLLGPQVSIDTPKDGEVISSPAFTMSGEAENAAWISLNGRQIFTDESGRWSEKLIAAEGLSIMTVNVRDRFGRTAEKSVRIILN